MIKTSAFCLIGFLTLAALQARAELTEIKECAEKGKDEKVYPRGRCLECSCPGPQDDPYQPLLADCYSCGSEQYKLTEEQSKNGCQLVEGGDSSLDYPDCCKPKVYCAGKIESYIVQGDASNKQGDKKESEKREESSENSELNFYKELSDLLARGLKEELQ